MEISEIKKTPDEIFEREKRVWGRKKERKKV